MKIEINGRGVSDYERAESLFFCGNGYLGVRGCLEEVGGVRFSTNRATYINGFYETRDIDYPERMHGFAPTGETQVSVIDGQSTSIEIGGEPFLLDAGTVRGYRRYLDMNRGITVHEALWTSPAGRTTRVRITRLVSLTRRNLFATKFEFERVNHAESIELITRLEFRPVRTVDPDDPRTGHDDHGLSINSVDLGRGTCAFSTARSQLCAEVAWRLDGQVGAAELTGDGIRIHVPLRGCSSEKLLSYAFGVVDHDGLECTFDELAAEQERFLARFWDGARVRVRGAEGLEESVNYGIYALLQSLGTDGRSSIAAKGLSGSGYEGHYFWDAETYVFPVFLSIDPDRARQMLLYRANALDLARENRELFGYGSGALYPWRTISGRECSPYFESGSAQHHINLDIGHAFIEFYRRTGDFDFMVEHGFEVLLECARVFLEIGYEREGSFHIDGVTGPDEYTVLVDDNYYTNRLAADQFRAVAELAERIGTERPATWSRLVSRLTIRDGELDAFRHAASIMALPFDEDLGIIAQDRGFLQKDPWPLPEEQTQHPLLLHYHPLVIYRHQVCKQADAVMVLLLFPDDFARSVSLRTVEYYDEITTHDSSLSYSAFATVYARLGELERAWDYFWRNARTDLEDVHGNTRDGVHIASMGGTYMTLIHGFCGLAATDDGLVVEPHLPDEIESVDFMTAYRGVRYRVHVDHVGGSVERMREETARC